MKRTIGLGAVLLIIHSLHAHQDTNDFHSFKTLYVTATVADHFDVYGRSFDPRIGLTYTFPIVYDFIHLDLTSEISPRPFFSPDYVRTIDNYKIHYSDSASYVRKEWGWDRKGMETVLSVYPTIYLKHFHIGLGGVMDIGYIYEHHRYILTDASKQDTAYKSNDSESGFLYFDSYWPGIKLGWRFSTFSISVTFEPNSIGLRYSKKIASRPSRNKKLRSSIFK